jgi:hypothetical protein
MAELDAIQNEIIAAHIVPGRDGQAGEPVTKKYAKK